MQLDAHVSFLGGETKLPNIRWEPPLELQVELGRPAWFLLTDVDVANEKKQYIQRRSLIFSWSSGRFIISFNGEFIPMGLTKSKPLEHRRELTATKKMCNIAKDKSIGTFPSKPSAWVDLLLQRISVYAKEHPRLARNHAKITLNLSLSQPLCSLVPWVLLRLCHRWLLFVPSVVLSSIDEDCHCSEQSCIVA